MKCPLHTDQEAAKTTAAHTLSSDVFLLGWTSCIFTDTGSPSHSITVSDMHQADGCYSFKSIMLFRISYCHVLSFCNLPRCLVANSSYMFRDGVSGWWQMKCHINEAGCKLRNAQHACYTFYFEMIWDFFF